MEVEQPGPASDRMVELSHLIRDPMEEGGAKCGQPHPFNLERLHTGWGGAQESISAQNSRGTCAPRSPSADPQRIFGAQTSTARASVAGIIYLYHHTNGTNML